MDLNEMHYFLTVCREKSYAKAAQQLFISAQGLGKAMRNLEKELDVPLFCSTESGRALTPYGEHLRDFCGTTLENYEELKRRFAVCAAGYGASIRLGFCYGCLGSIGVSFLDDFNRAHGNIHLDFHEYTDVKCDALLLDGSLDLAVTVAPYDPAFHTEELRSERSYFWVNTKNPLSQRESLGFSDIEREAIATIGTDFKMKSAFPEACLRQGFVPNIQYTTCEMSLLYQVARLGSAISLTTEHDSIMQGDEVRAVLFAPLNWSYGISYRKERELSAAERLFIEYLKAYVRGAP